MNWILVKTCLLCLQELLHSVPWLLSLLLLMVAHLLSQNIYEEWSSFCFFVKLFTRNQAIFDHLNAHFLLQLHHFLSSALLLIKDKITCNDIKQVCTLTKLFLCLGGHSYLFALESGVHQFRLHTHCQASCVPASFAVGPSDAVHLKIRFRTNVNSCLQQCNIHLAKIIPADTDITSGDASSEECPARITADRPIMLQGKSIYAKKLWGKTQKLKQKN